MDIIENEPIASYTTFGVGGLARFFTFVTSFDEMKEAVLFSKQKKIPFFVLGKGSNCLFDDRGYKGLVILNKIDFCNIENEKVKVGSGTSFCYLGLKTAKLGLTGLEFASGIPATVGGAIYMNAGAQGQSTWDKLEEIDYLDENMSKKKLFKKDFFYGYRTSLFQGSKKIILSATFKLEKLKLAKEQQKEMLSYRTKTQPYGEKSAGCIFRNTKEISAGKVVDQCGLKGMQIGKAKVSEIHGNFIVAEKGCKSSDVCSLILVIQKTVKEKKGIELQTEVRVIPYES